jgi:hypothetical protein
MLHDVGHVPMLDDPSGIVSVIRDFITRAGQPRSPRPEGVM